MDVLSHSLAGSLIADALPFTKRLGPKAPVVAVIAAVAPDIDLLPAFLANFPPKEFSSRGLFDWNVAHRFHRTYTHSFFVTTIASVPLGYAAWRWSGRKGHWWQWSLLIFLAFMSHIILDLTTIWDTKALLPFSDAPMAFSALPFIDPFLILVMGLVFILNHILRDSYRRADPAKPIAEWRKKTAALVDRLGGATRVGVIGLLLVLGRIVIGVATAGTLGHVFR